MHLSVREVFQLSERCFAAAGFAEGPARANAEAMWWTEAYRGAGLDTLHGLLSELPELDRAALTCRDRSGAASVIEAGGQPSVVSSTPATDLSCSHADQHGVGIVRATVRRGDASFPALGHVAHTAAERGFLPVVLAADGRDRAATVVGVPDRPRPLLAEVELAAPSVGYRRLLEVLRAGCHGRRDTPLTQAFFADAGTTGGEYPVADQRLLARLLRRATEPAGGAEGEGEGEPGFVTVCFDPRHPLRADGLARVVERFVDGGRLDERAGAETTVFRPADVQARAERLLREGVDVEEAVWRDVFEFSSGILAPPFEGSHRGAGFDINE